MKNQQIQAAMTEIRFADMVDISVVRRDSPRSTHVPSNEANKRIDRVIVIPLKSNQHLWEAQQKMKITCRGILK